MKQLALALVLFCACSGATAVAPPDASPEAAAPTDGGSGRSDAGVPDSADAAAPAALFLGTWKVTKGSSLVVCPGAPHWPPEGMTMDDKGGVVHITPGSTADTIVLVQEGAGCSFTYVVDGNVAKTTGHPTCTPSGPVVGGCSTDAGDPAIDGGHRHDGGSSPPLWVLDDDTLTLSADGRSYAESYDEELHDYFALCDLDTVVTYDCRATGADTLERQ